jgi:hypothetical protein
MTNGEPLAFQPGPFEWQNRAVVEGDGVLHMLLWRTFTGLSDR